MKRVLYLCLGFVLSACGRPTPIEAEFPRAVEPLRAAGPLGPTILYPRHRIISPTPRMEIVTPGDQGPIRVLLLTSTGRRREWITDRRRLPWPEGWLGLGVGEVGELRVQAGRFHTRVRFERGVAPNPPLWAVGGQAERRLWLAGMPIESILRSPRSAGAGTRRAALRAVGLGAPPLWRLLPAPSF